MSPITGLNYSKLMQEEALPWGFGDHGEMGIYHRGTMIQKLNFEENRRINTMLGTENIKISS